ncbi:hypothetical protein HDZ31DRAFT_74003 [Schizophyllum fasciatum]
MDPSTKIVDMSKEQLVGLKWLGDGVKAMVEKVCADPDNLKQITYFQIERLASKYTPAQSTAQGAAASPPTSPTSQPFPTSPVRQLGRPHRRRSQPSLGMNFWYHGISGDPPKLLYRSDLETNHFPLPQIGDRFFRVPTKTAYGVFNSHLNQVWDDDVAPRIRDLMKSHGIKYSSLMTARFSTVVEENGDETFGPVVVWIAVHPNFTDAQSVHDVTPEVLHILNDAQVTDNTSSAFGLNYPFNAGLGIPIARADDDAQGTVTLLFKEVKTRDGVPSDKILALTNKHVASRVTTTDYDHDLKRESRLTGHAICIACGILNGLLLFVYTKPYGD